MTRETPAPTKIARVLVLTASRIFGGTGGIGEMISSDIILFNRIHIVLVAKVV
jgi:hypothetical protein